MSIDPQKTIPPPAPPPAPHPATTKAPVLLRPPSRRPLPRRGLLGLSSSTYSFTMNHWAYWVPSNAKPIVGVLIHATGDVRNGFKLETKRKYDLLGRCPVLDEKAMLNGGEGKYDDVPVGGLEVSARKVKAPEKTLNTVDDRVNSGKKITQRNCQTWIVESADQLVQDGIFHKEVAAYPHAIEQ
ncbi:hypothetical protein TOPH_02477 [Tolypocladium ophioglossoides CBS 100239]|uniref:Uncharacterized protein n=1 Tax=Tolypocladium ophioglossoides (strain CBS 100239) TaxID=1163406 RepID=A0A0L0NGQ0_TOLOC|nr:hypothetical protein TOPH_02477 [Tolypocladium ophioglossoides CBS 100239]